MTWVRTNEVRVGMLVRVKADSAQATARHGGVVRQIEGDNIFVEPDFPDVDDDGLFAMWKCRKNQLLVERRK